MNDNEREQLEWLKDLTFRQNQEIAELKIQNRILQDLLEGRALSEKEQMLLKTAKAIISELETKSKT